VGIQNDDPHAAEYRAALERLVIAPTFEMSLRQSLIMSNGTWTIFFGRPIAAVLLAVSATLLILSAISFFMKRKDWRTKLAEAEQAEPKP